VVVVMILLSRSCLVAQPKYSSKIAFLYRKFLFLKARFLFFVDTVASQNTI